MSSSGDSNTLRKKCNTYKMLRAIAAQMLARYAALTQRQIAEHLEICVWGGELAGVVEEIGEGGKGIGVDRVEPRLGRRRNHLDRQEGRKKGAPSDLHDEKLTRRGHRPGQQSHLIDE